MDKKQRKGFVIFLLISGWLFLGIFLVTESRIISTKPVCEDGCWRTIKLGDGKDLVLDKLAKMNDLQYIEVEEKDTEDGKETSIRFKDTHTSDLGVFTFKDDSLIEVRLSIYGRLTLGKTFFKLGKPTYINPTYRLIDTKTIESTFIYPEKRICARAVTISIPPILGFLPVFISPTNQVGYVAYYQSEDADWYKEKCPGRVGEEYLQKWEGFLHKYRVYPD